MSWIDAILIGAVQGVTECLPISSSAHLVIAEKLLGIKASGVAFEVILHCGTLAAAVVFFRTQWLNILSGPCEPSSRRSLGLLVAGTIPVAVVGFLFHDLIAGKFHDMQRISLHLILCGIFLLAAGRKRAGQGEIGWGRAWAVGVAQAAAILPGVSRSGMTVGMGMLSGARCEHAVEFAFMLSVPAVLGASIMELRDFGPAISGFGWGVLVTAAAASFLSGYAAIGVLLTLVRKGRLAWFGWYCVTIGMVAMLWGWIR